MNVAVRLEGCCISFMIWPQESLNVTDVIVCPNSRDKQIVRKSRKAFGMGNLVVSILGNNIVSKYLSC